MSKKKKKDSTPKKMKRKAYERELAKLEVELVKLQGWIKDSDSPNGTGQTAVITVNFAPPIPKRGKIRSVFGGLCQ